ncbi:helix-turn-helix transcriptional regulator [Leucobacter denitrificans]|uniref:HTH luxR-type domain-containing protein n=1 Tax=Leucobacter denitrificans TaxID=683042 RepID=A0A7G9S6Z0_9MICO|nr:LuxR family transcriptional regulator [Leucobacter denitrificans]QNN63615.1 hypothetical protein H9L06_04725 [Leucobacter denitrificans]
MASLRQNAFAALALSGIVELAPARRIDGVIEEIGRQLTELVTDDQTVFFLDDWDDLDEASWGVIEYVRRTTGVPIVISRLQGLRARHTPTGLHASTLEPTYVIDMLPLRFDDLDAAVSSYLGGPIEPGTSRRIYAKTGGNVGLALSLVDAMSRDGALVQIDGNAWTAAGELWSPALRAVMEMHLESLEPVARDALETIAMIGPADVETVRNLVDWTTLEVLEERAMIAFAQGARSNLVSVVPPLFNSYFRHDPLSARRIRLTERINDVLGTTSRNFDIDSTWDTPDAGAEQKDALFAGMLRENSKTLQLVASYEWEKTPTVSSANSYLEVLSQIGLEATCPTIERIFTETDWEAGDLASRAEFCARQAEWLAYRMSEVDQAVELLETRAPELKEYGRMLDAKRISILADCRAVPEGFEAALEVTEDLPQNIQIVLLETQLQVLTIGCRLKDATRVYRELKRLDPEGIRVTARALYGMAQLAQGHYKSGLRDLSNGLDEARGSLDLPAFRLFAGAVAYAHLHSGDMQELGSLVDVALSTGELSPLPPGSRIAILVGASVLATSKGQIALCQKYAEMARSEGEENGPLPGQQIAWIDAQIEILNGNAQAGAETLWKASQSLKERGAIYAAQLGMLASVEISMNKDRLAETLRLLEEFPDATVLGAQGRYLAALEARDPEGVFQAGKILERHARNGVALAAYGRAAEWFGEKDAIPARMKALKEERRLRTSAGSRVFNTTRFGTMRTFLSKREREVAALAAKGLSNQDIATHLVLSVRTVESHMHRIMRKFGVSTRDALNAKLVGNTQGLS